MPNRMRPVRPGQKPADYAESYHALRCAAGKPRYRRSDVDLPSSTSAGKSRTSSDHQCFANAGEPRHHRPV